jgi:ribA/ribD-fused uncharacterized protein
MLQEWGRVLTWILERFGMIKFHLKSGPYGWLSNFAPYPIIVDDREWPTSEHYYQAAKFPSDPQYQEEIRQNVRPYDAWRFGRNPVKPVRADWDEVKETVMLTAVRAKFEQHGELAARLLGTGTVELVEHAPNDPYWGDGGDGHGANRLGHILMQVRTELGRMS